MSSDLLSKVLARLTEMIADEFKKLFLLANSFTSAGAVTVSTPAISPLLSLPRGTGAEFRLPPEFVQSGFEKTDPGL